jgi:nicotinate-nucleotide pyrophosphorylase (carboxylating)
MGPVPKAWEKRLVLDVREEILRSVRARRVVAAIVADQPGVVSGVSLAKAEAGKLGVFLAEIVGEGSSVQEGDAIARLVGTPRQIVMAEDVLIGLLAKPSGIATRAREFVAKANGRPKVVSGGWKKMPGAMKEMIRNAVSAGGAQPRIVPGPFAYLDKNYIELLGGIRESLAAVAHLGDLAKVVQVKGRYADVVSEARLAAEHGADVVFADTGRAEDVARVAEALVRLGLRKKVLLAFGGGVSLDDVEALRTLDVDILDIGRQIVDAPLLDMRLEIVDAQAAA